MLKIMSPLSQPPRESLSVNLNHSFSKANNSDEKINIKKEIKTKILKKKGSMYLKNFLLLKSGAVENMLFKMQEVLQMKDL